MKKEQASYTITLDTRRKKKDGTFPVKLRVFFKTEKRRYSTGLYLSKEDFEMSYVDKPIQKRHKQINKQIRELASEIDEILDNIGVFSFEKFESRIQTKSAKNDLFSSFDVYINKLRKEKRISTANSYIQAKTSIQKYTSKKILPFEEVNSSFLKKYESKMIEAGRSVSTVGIYLRYVRNLFNLAIKEGLVKADYYPFGKGKYQIANTPKTYKALTNEELKKLIDEPVEEGSIEQFYRDLWFFSYFGNGINTKDMVLLKFSNIKDNIIHFKRAKTILTNRTAPEGEIPIIAPLQKIIEQWGNDPELKDNFIFPILKPNMNDDQILKTVHQTNKQISKYIRRIAKRAGIKHDISVQYARHTFTTKLVQSGVPLPSISKRLVHESIDTTSKYIGRNSSLQEFEISNLLIP
jgi:site-specific recombinase XerD